MKDKFVRFNDPEAAKMLAELAKKAKRTEGNQVAILIREEYSRVFSPILMRDGAVVHPQPDFERG